MNTCPGELGLHACGICKSYGGKAVLDDVSFAVAPGRLVAIVGRSGAGKTTLFNILAGILEPDAGGVFLDGRDITGRSGALGYMGQKDLLLPFKRVADNVALPLVLAGGDKRAARAEVGAMFKTFGLDGCQQLYPAQLSGGERQRAALMRTFFQGRGTTLLDEPFSALDAFTKADMHRWFSELVRDVGLTALFITHDIDEAVSLADEVAILAGAPARLAACVPISPPPPRGADFALSPRFLEYKARIMGFL